MAQTLSNGYCGLPVTQQGCPHANACLTCSNFRADAKFLPLHEKQLKETEHIMALLKNLISVQQQSE